MMQEKKKMPEDVKSAGVICERLWSAVYDLLSSSLRLEDALIHRRKDEIWEILSEQQKKSSVLNQAATLWSQVYGENYEEMSPELASARKNIKAALGKLQIVKKVNYSLTRNYLAAVEKSMVQAGAGLAGKKKVYNKGGRLGVRGSSMIFKSIG